MRGHWDIYWCSKWTKYRLREKNNIRKYIFKKIFLTRWETINKRISGHSRTTGTNGIMINDIANCVASATSGTNVPTLLIGTRFVLRAIWIYYTFGPASRRCSDESAYATAYGLHVILSALTVWTAWRRITWIANGGCYNTIRKDFN